MPWPGSPTAGRRSPPRRGQFRRQRPIDLATLSTAIRDATAGGDRIIGQKPLADLLKLFASPLIVGVEASNHLGHGPHDTERMGTVRVVLASSAGRYQPHAEGFREGGANATRGITESYLEIMDKAQVERIGLMGTSFGGRTAGHSRCAASTIRAAGR